jgi:DNA-binding HxlR family transcriptional regulator
VSAPRATHEAPTITLAELPGRPCAIAASLEVVGDRWSLLVVREVALGNHRFTEIARGTGAPRDRLTARLRDLVDAGVLERRPYQGTRCEYHLTPSGRELVPILERLYAWGRAARRVARRPRPTPTARRGAWTRRPHDQPHRHRLGTPGVAHRVLARPGQAGRGRARDARHRLPAGDGGR